ncbi:unnamed protein product, partial [Rotaria sp. Silwood1]
LDISKEEMNNDDEQEVPGNDEDNIDEPPSKKARKINTKTTLMDNMTYNERFGNVCKHADYIRDYTADLDNNLCDRSETLSFESEFNTICSTLSSNDALLLITNETGREYLYNVKCRRLIGIHRFGHDIRTIEFSLDFKSVAVCRSNRYEFYTCPSTDRQFNLFTLKFILHSFHDKITFVKWTSDFLVLTVISTDMTTKIFSVSLLDKLYRFILVSHVCEIVDTFFEQDSLNVHP